MIRRGPRDDLGLSSDSALRPAIQRDPVPADEVEEFRSAGEVNHINRLG